MGKISWLLEIINNNLSILDRKLEELSPEDMIRDPFYMNSVLHILQVSSRALIDLASHIIAEAGIAIVDKYSSIPKILEGNGILGREDSTLFRKIIGFRNIVVHCYTRVSDKILLDILENRSYRDILRLAAEISRWARSRDIDP